MSFVHFQNRIMKRNTALNMQVSESQFNTCSKRVHSYLNTTAVTRSCSHIIDVDPPPCGDFLMTWTVTM